VTAPAEPGGEEPLVVTPDMLAPDEPPPGSADGRTDFEAGISYLPVATILLFVLNIVVFGWQLQVGALENEESIVRYGALLRERVLLGEWWRLLSATVLHGGIEHLLGNLMALYVIGVGLEHAIGARNTLVVYLACGLGASLASVALNTTPSVGASGAIFGMMGVITVFLWRHRDRFEVRDRRVAGVMAVWAGITVLTGMFTPYIDNAAHVGGLVAGGLIGLRMDPRG
jgi:rhomboid protease GluP